jgi:glycosyltransferase involved in cell wall biosynthesis
MMLNTNPWEEPLIGDLEIIKRSLNRNNKTITFLTLDPLLQSVNVKSFIEFVKSIDLPVFGFLHRIPDNDRELSSINQATKLLKGVFLLSDVFAENISKILETPNLFSIPHHPSKFNFCPTNGDSLKKKMNIGNKAIVVGLIGELRRDKGLENILKSFKYFCDEARRRFCFIVGGKCTDYDVGKIKSSFEANGFSYRLFCGMNPYLKSYIYLDSVTLTKLISMIDIGLLLYDGIQGKVASGVLSDYIWLNKSVLSTATSYVGQEVARNKLGYLLLKNDPEEIAAFFNDFTPGMLKISCNTHYKDYRKKIDPLNVASMLVNILDEAIDFQKNIIE